MHQIDRLPHLLEAMECPDRQPRTKERHFLPSEGCAAEMKRSESVAARAAVVVEDAFEGGFGDDWNVVFACFLGFAGE